MKTNQLTIHAVQPALTAIQVAANCYKQWMGDVTLEQDIADYLLNGCVVSRPSCFGLAKVIELPETKERAWFIRMAVGNLLELFTILPCYLPKICFCRRNDGRLRIYSLDKLMKLAIKVNNRGEIT